MYHRTEVAATKQFRVPPEWCIEDVCRENVRRVDPKTAEEKNDFDFLSRVTGPVAWPAFHSRERAAAAMQSCLANCTSTNWAASGSWQKRLGTRASCKRGQCWNGSGGRTMSCEAIPTDCFSGPFRGTETADSYLATRNELRLCVLARLIFPPKSSQVFRLETKFLLLSTCSLWATVVNTPEQ